LATLIQRRVAKLDEYGSDAKPGRDLVRRTDRKARSFEKTIQEYTEKILDILTRETEEEDTDDM
jgi:hypothetical protein